LTGISPQVLPSQQFTDLVLWRRWSNWAPSHPEW